MTRTLMRIFKPSVFLVSVLALYFIAGLADNYLRWFEMEAKLPIFAGFVVVSYLILRYVMYRVDRYAESTRRAVEEFKEKEKGKRGGEEP